MRSIFSAEAVAVNQRKKLKYMPEGQDVTEVEVKLVENDIG